MAGSSAQDGTSLDDLFDDSVFSSFVQQLGSSTQSGPAGAAGPSASAGAGPTAIDTPMPDLAALQQQIQQHFLQQQHLQQQQQQQHHHQQHQPDPSQAQSHHKRQLSGASSVVPPLGTAEALWLKQQIERMQLQPSPGAGPSHQAMNIPANYSPTRPPLSQSIHGHISSVVPAATPGAAPPAPGSHLHPQQQAPFGSASNFGLITPMSSGSFQPNPVSYVSPFKMPDVYPTPPQLQLAGQHAVNGALPHTPHPTSTPMGAPSLPPNAAHLGINTSTPASAHVHAAAAAAAAAMSAYTPMQSPAITPASVFSQMSAASMGSTNDFFTPLTSPALGPDPMGHHHALPHHSAAASAVSAGSMASPLFMPQHSSVQAQMQGRSTTPTASPLALIGKPSPASALGSAGSSRAGRGGRTSTAEAKAAKVRPSPIIKPSDPKSKRGGGANGHSASASSGSIGSGAGASVASALAAAAAAAASSAHPSPSASPYVGPSTSTPSSSSMSFPSIFAQSHSASRKPMDASPSEAASTPSPIDLSATSMLPPTGPGSSKPLTPGALMGIRSGLSAAAVAAAKHSPSQPSTLSSEHPSGGILAAAAAADGSPESSSGSSGPAASKGKAKSEQASVRFADEAVGMRRSGSLSKGNNRNGGDESSSTPPATATSMTSTTATTSRASGLESRRTSHKAAEQKRRDSLKFCFDELRGYLPNITLDEDAPGGSTLCADGFAQDAAEEGFDWDEVRRVKLQQEMGVLPPMPPRPGVPAPPPPEYTVAPRASLERLHRQEREMAARRLANKGVSKVALLRHSNEYLVRLKKRLERREESIEVLEMERNHWRDRFLALEAQLRGLGAAAVAAAAAAAVGQPGLPPLGGGGGGGAAPGASPMGHGEGGGGDAVNGGNPGAGGAMLPNGLGGSTAAAAAATPSSGLESNSMLASGQATPAAAAKALQDFMEGLTHPNGVAAEGGGGSAGHAGAGGEPGDGGPAGSMAGVRVGGDEMETGADP